MWGVLCMWPRCAQCPGCPGSSGRGLHVYSCRARCTQLSLSFTKPIQVQHFCCRERLHVPVAAAIVWQFPRPAGALPACPQSLSKVQNRCVTVTKAIAASLRQFASAPLPRRAGAPRVLWERGAALGTLQLRSGLPNGSTKIKAHLLAPVWDCEARKRAAQVCIVHRVAWESGA